MAFIAIVMVACFEDKGNYDYHDINQLTVGKVDSVYYCDQYDSLYIHPELTGTLYSEDGRFEYEWTINNKVISNDKDLKIRVEIPLGRNSCKYIITDKDLGTKTYYNFNLQVTSSTASDAIMVLCNYKGKAELSFKRLDRNAPFMEVFYENVNGEVLGEGAAYKFEQNFSPFERLGGILVHTDDGLMALDATTITPVGRLDGAYVYSKAVPKPQLGAYQVSGFAVWPGRNTEFFGMQWIDCYSFIVADGNLTLFQYMNMGDVLFSCKVVESPYGGAFSPVAYPSYRGAGGLGYDMAEEFNMFDETAGRFVRCDVVAYRQAYAVDGLKAFPGYKLIYGNPVQEQYYSVAMLNNGVSSKLLYMKTPAFPSNIFSAEIVGEVDVATNILDADCDFAMRSNTPFLFWAKGNKVYEYNVNNIFSPGVAPSASNVVTSLDRLNLGYDANAVITCMYLTRSQKNLILGVSRYGDDKEGNTDELKGDVVVLDANTYEVKDYYPGVTGYPVDIMVKYQENYRGGLDENGNMMDNI